MRRAIVTAAIGDKYLPMAALTIPTQKAWAERIGAAHVVLESVPAELEAKTGHWAKFRIGAMLEEFEEIAWIDSDIAVSPAAPSIFEAAGGKLAAYPEGDVVDRLDAFREYYRRLRGKDLAKGWQKYYNSGVLVVPRMAKNILSVPEKIEMEATVKMRAENPGRFFFDQNLINARIAESGLEVQSLSWRWNLMHVPAENSGISWDDRSSKGWLVHYAGMVSMLGDKVLDLVRTDLGKWGFAYGNEEKEKSEK
jgi:hypothetical protein